MPTRPANTGHKTGRPCSVCTHPQRNEVDRLLVVPGSPAAEIARLFGLNQRSVTRHRVLHLSKLLQAEEAQRHAISEAERGGNLIDQARAYEDRALTILNNAMDTKDYSLALRAIREARDSLVVQAKFTGLVKTGSVVNIYNDNRWLTIQTGIVDALGPFPQAKEAVLRVLAEPVN